LLEPSRDEFRGDTQEALMAERASELVRAGELRWRSVTIEASSPAVRVARRPTIDGIGLLVRFPLGWERPSHGSYDVAEEVVFLAGTFEMSGVRFAAGDHAYLPPGYLRTGSSSSTGALAWAWFSGANHWQASMNSATPPDASAGIGTAWRDSLQAQPAVTSSAWSTGPSVPVPELGLPARPLHDDGSRGSYVLEALSDPLRVPDTLRGVEVFDLATHASAAAPTGETLAPLPVGPVLMVVTR
jgi:hypothetical protein